MDTSEVEVDGWVQFNQHFIGEEGRRRRKGRRGGERRRGEMKERKRGGEVMRGN